MTHVSRTALVTGGNAGLGAALCRQLLAADWRVVSIDRGRGEPPEGAIHITCDFGERHALDTMLPAILAAGPFDLVVHNAGISATGRFTDIPAEAQLQLIRVNAEAPLVLTDAMISQGTLRKGAALVFVASLSHFTGYPGAAVYAATKDAITAYAKSISPFCKAQGLTVSVAYPGPLRTDHAARHAPEGADAAKRMDPDVAAEAILTGAARGDAAIVPGISNRLYALAGQVAPAIVTRLMRRVTLDRLSQARW